MLQSMNALAPWHDFFLLVGGASATLLGLVFVAGSIAATIPSEKLGDDDSRALWTVPIIYAFVRPLVVSAIALVPHGDVSLFAITVGMAAVADLARSASVLRGLLRHHRDLERLDWSDWRDYFLLPTLATLIAGAGAAGLPFGAPLALEAIALALLIHVAVGIRNAWGLTDWLITRT